MSTSSNPAQPVNQTPPPTGDQSKKDALATVLVAEWEHVTDAAGNLAKAIHSLGRDEPDFGTAKSHLTKAISSLAHTPQKLSLLHTKFKK